MFSLGKTPVLTAFPGDLRFRSNAANSLRLNA